MFKPIAKKLLPHTAKVVLMNLKKYGSPAPKIKNNTTKNFDICRDFNCLFIHIPKTAGISIYRTIFQMESIGHSRLSNYYNLYGSHFVNTRFKFCFVRNPYDRLHSAYNYLIAGGRGYPIDLEYKEILAESKNFEDFVTNFLHLPEIHYMEHFRLQTYWIKNHNGIIDMDFIGRFENINDDFKVIASKLNLQNGKLHKTNTSKTKFKSEFKMNQKIKDKIYKIYKEDFIELNYEK